MKTKNKAGKFAKGLGQNSNGIGRGKLPLCGINE
jgi:hypothetical protein